MQKAFAEAWINYPHTVYGRRLRPFCLRHLFLLSLLENPACAGLDCDELQLRQAALICSLPHSKLEQNRLSLNWLQRTWWAIRSNRCKHGKELVKWKSYIQDYDSRPEIVAEDQEGPGALNAPAILSTITFIEINSNMRQEEILTAPVGKMFWLAASISELLGQSKSKILTDEQLAQAEALDSLEDA